MREVPGSIPGQALLLLFDNIIFVGGLLCNCCLLFQSVSDDDCHSVGSSAYSRRYHRLTAAPPRCVPTVEDKSGIKGYVLRSQTVLVLV